MTASERRPAGTAEAVPLDGLPALLQLPGVRAAALVLRDGADVVVADSAGYDCDAMAPGARLPLDAGLPVTEAVRTGRQVVQGSGPSWVALPLPFLSASAELPAGGLLLLHTDGLLDRRGPSGTVPVDPLELLRDLRTGDPADLADQVLAAAASYGTVTDDVSLLVARPRG